MFLKGVEGLRFFDTPCRENINFSESTQDIRRSVLRCFYTLIAQLSKNW